MNFEIHKTLINEDSSDLSPSYFLANSCTISQEISKEQTLMCDFSTLMHQRMNDQEKSLGKQNDHLRNKQPHDGQLQENERCQKSQPLNFPMALQPPSRVTDYTADHFVDKDQPSEDLEEKSSAFSPGLLFANNNQSESEANVELRGDMLRISLPRDTVNNQIRTRSANYQANNLQIEKNKQYLIQRKQKTFLENKSQLANMNSRKDVAFKSLLRSIRRYYLKLFHTHTNFKGDKQRKHPNVYRQKLALFVQLLLPKLFRNKQQTPEDLNEVENIDMKNQLIFIFGSIFYHKIMLLDSNFSEQRQDIQLIRSCLYFYSNNTLKELLEKYEGLQMIINYSFSIQHEILIDDYSNSKELKDCFKFLSEIQFCTKSTS